MIYRDPSLTFEIGETVRLKNPLPRSTAPNSTMRGLAGQWVTIEEYAEFADGSPAYHIVEDDGLWFYAPEAFEEEVQANFNPNPADLYAR